MNALILFASTFVVVTALSLQSLNVVGGHRAMAFVTSFMIGGANLVLLKIAPQPTGMIENLGFLLGGPLGVLFAMTIHPWILRRLRKTPPG